MRWLLLTLFNLHSIMEYTLLIAAKQSGLPHYSPHENIAPHYGVITMMGGYRLSDD